MYSIENYDLDNDLCDAYDLKEARKHQANHIGEGIEI